MANKAWGSITKERYHLVCSSEIQLQFEVKGRVDLVRTPGSQQLGERRGHLGKALHDLPGLVLLVVGEQASHHHHHHKSNPNVEVVVSLQ